MFMSTYIQVQNYITPDPKAPYVIYLQMPFFFSSGAIVKGEIY